MSRSVEVMAQLKALNERIRTLNETLRDECVKEGNTVAYFKGELSIRLFIPTPTGTAYLSKEQAKILSDYINKSLTD
jgi:hypothetical protein